MAIKVALREKLISKGKKSLYLDFYPPIMHPKTGKLTRREFINMYLFMDKKEIKLIIDKLEQKLKNKKNGAENFKNIKTQLNELQDFYKLLYVYLTNSQLKYYLFYLYSLLLN